MARSNGARAPESAGAGQRHGILADTGFVEGHRDPRATLLEHGYAFLPQLLPRQQVLELRTEFLEHAAQGGWLAPDGAPADALAGPDPGGIRGSEPYRRMLCSERFHRLGGAPAIAAAVAAILDGPVFELPRKMVRAAWPQAVAGPTAPHQDLPQVSGSPDTITAWIPLGDYAAGDGRLVVLAGSHRAGLLTPDARWAVDTADLDLAWHGSDFRAGDVLLFHALTVHAGEPNSSPRLRLSMDARFQLLDDPVAPESLIPDRSSLGWDDVYRDWASTAGQRYWEELELEVRHRPVSLRGMRAQARSRLLASESSAHL